MKRYPTTVEEMLAAQTRSSVRGRRAWFILAVFFLIMRCSRGLGLSVRAPPPRIAAIAALGLLTPAAPAPAWKSLWDIERIRTTTTFTAAQPAGLAEWLHTFTMRGETA
ncbi:hypothetical protein [Sinomonas mesophila]|uniref:hypothetical protein n=1 Tax=Sinomonas mesophila TaxID=1531955 RepID=UPI0011156016|nr:hypothetical protein [Sinomonas mesophila]